MSNQIKPLDTEKSFPATLETRRKKHHAIGELPLEQRSSVLRQIVDTSRLAVRYLAPDVAYEVDTPPRPQDYPLELEAMRNAQVALAAVPSTAGESIDSDQAEYNKAPAMPSDNVVDLNEARRIAEARQLVTNSGAISAPAGDPTAHSSFTREYPRQESYGQAFAELGYKDVA